MADGSKTEYESLKGTDEVTFYNLMDLHKKKIEKLKQNHDARK